MLHGPQRLPPSLWSCSVHALTLLDPLQSRIVSRDANAARNMLACACLPQRPPWLMRCQPLRGLHHHDSCPSGGDQQAGRGGLPLGRAGRPAAVALRRENSLPACLPAVTPRKTPLMVSSSVRQGGLNPTTAWL